MKLIQINPTTQTVETVETGASLDEFYALLNCQTSECCARQNNGDSLILDEEALFAEPQPPAFGFDGMGPFHGMALVAGVEEDGKDTEPAYSVDQVRDRVTWLGNVHTQPVMRRAYSF